MQVFVLSSVGRLIPQIFSKLGIDIVDYGNEISQIKDEKDHNPVVPIKAEDPAYIIYTSGSTGMPKGVIITHKNVTNLVTGLSEAIFSKYSSPLRVALVASYVFDASMQQIYGALFLGHSLWIVPNEVKQDGHLLVDYFKRQNIDVADGTPAHLRSMLDRVGHKLKDLNIQHLIIGGDRLPPKLLDDFLGKLGNDKTVITNIYGIAECGVDSTAQDYNRKNSQGISFASIGSPLSNQEIYIVNQANQICPPGVPGEICISGENVGKGYVNNEALTLQRFINNPFDPDRRMFRTGDLGRLWANGALEFIGRNDHQIKIRGYRIELSEIEHHLQTLRMPAHAALEKRFSVSKRTDPILRCQRCVLSSKYPNIQFDSESICNVCRDFEQKRSKTLRYFQSADALRQVIESAQSKSESAYDCLLLYSGGKDSSYVLYRLVEMGLNVLAFTFDNGFISEAAFANIRRQTSRLNVECIIEKTESMHEIFVESLQNDHTVCSGCFRSLTAISTRIAHERKINLIITGLSRGQIFDTKLKDLHSQNIFDNGSIEEKLVLFRKMYHANDDQISRLLNVDLNAVNFSKFHFVDFFRYDNSPTLEIRDYLRNRDKYWDQPKDTGFCSSNCMMNDIGICIHSQEEGYHNYEGPLSWDIRLGIATRSEALGEVESSLNLKRIHRVLDKIGYFHKEIKNAVVVPRKSKFGELLLCAYFVSNQKIAISELRNHLSKFLPDYMIPNHFVRLERLPLNASGKIDRDALPSPEDYRIDLHRNPTPANTKIEKAFVEIWGEVLQADTIGIHDNFFELGGDSIINIQIVNRANNRGINITPAQLFENPTIADLAEVANTELLSEIDQSIVIGEVELTPIQEWFFQQELPNPSHWNNAILLEVNCDLNLSRIQEAIKALMNHHDVLRSHFKPSVSGWRQMISEAAVVPHIAVHDFSHFSTSMQESKLEEAASRMHESLDISRGILLRVAYFNLGNSQNRKARILFIVHHLVIDGISWMIFLEDFQTAYTQLEKGERISLPSKTHSYQQWSSLLQEASSSKRIIGELSHWLGQIQRSHGLLPRDITSPSIPDSVAHSYTIAESLDRKQTATLLHNPFGTEKNIHPHDVILTAIAKSITEWTRSKSFFVTLEGHGRQDLLERINISRTMGWFTTLYPVLLEVPGEEVDLWESVREIKEQLRQIPNRGVGFGILRYLCKTMKIPNSLKSNSLPEILFNYLGQLDLSLSKSKMFRLKNDLILSRDPAMKRPFLIEINAFVTGDQLNVTWSYSKAFYHQRTIKHLATRTTEHLQAILSSENLPYNTSPTPSDFPDAGIGQEELDAILAEFGE